MYFIVNLKIFSHFSKKKNVRIHFKIPALDKLMQQSQDVSLFLLSIVMILRSFLLTKSDCYFLQGKSMVQSSDSGDGESPKASPPSHNKERLSSIVREISQARLLSLKKRKSGQSLTPGDNGNAKTRKRSP